jgi:hypothetical protein
MAGRRSPRARRELRWALAAVTLAAGCNAIFGIHEGKPRPLCADTEANGALEPVLDDLEDGDRFICASNGRNGTWYSYSDGTSTDLTPKGDFKPTLIDDKKRGTSRYAARLTGSGFTRFGAAMGFTLSEKDLARQTYDASTVFGIKFWMKSTAPVRVSFITPQTLPSVIGGDCMDGATELNCNHAFGFEITAPSADWVEYEVPFAALQQRAGGSLTWNPRNLVSVEFQLAPFVGFDVWVDDVRFYRCDPDSCLPTCADPAFPVQCPATGPASSDLPARCWPRGANCADRPGCNSSNTSVAPADGQITAFAGSGDGVDILGTFGVGARGPAPTYTTEGALHMTLNAPVTSTSQVLRVDLQFNGCVDATRFEGVRFSIGGSVSGCTLAFAARDSAHVYYDGTPMARERYGTGPTGAHAPFTTLTAAQLTSAPQTLMIPFASQSGGVPETPIDRSKLTDLKWIFFVDPSTPGGPASCTADVTVDDVRFY